MQNKTVSTKPSHTKKIKKYFAFTIVILFTVCILFFSESPAKTIRRSLELCYSTVIPAVFPFMVISSFLISIGGHNILGNFFSRPLRIIFGTSPSAACSVVLGFLCGFPIGASSAYELYKKNEIESSELERLLMFVNNPSVAFAVGGVGLGLFNSRKVGQVLYIIVILSAVTVGVLSRLFYPQCTKKISLTYNEEDNISVFDSFTSSISSSALNMLNVCACVLFFSIPTALITELLAPLGVSQISSAFFASFFEISGGVAASASVKPSIIAIMLCAFALSWSGASVHLQVFSVCKGCDISFAPYIFAKLFQGALSSILAYMYFTFCEDISELSFATGDISVKEGSQGFFFVIFIISLLVALLARRHHSAYTDNEGGCIR